MALVLNDRVKETTSTNGTGTIDLAGAETGFETFVAGIGNTNTTYYCIVHQAADEFEIGLGTVSDSTPDTLSRTTIISSSNSDSAVNFSAGTKDVFCTLPASKAVFADASDNVGIGTSSPNRKLTVFKTSSPVLNIKNSDADLHLEQAGQNSYIGNSSTSGFLQLFTNNGNFTSQFNSDGSFQIGAATIPNLKFSQSSDVISITAKKDGTDDIDLAFHTQASGGTTGERMRVTSGGEVGIGTSTPTLGKFQVHGSKYVVTNSGKALGGIHVSPDSGAALGEYGGAISFSAGGNGSSAIAAVNTTGSDNDSMGLALFTHGSSTGSDDATERMRIDANGNVGIGENSPDSLLHVNSGTTNVAAKFESTDSIASVQFTDSGGSCEIGGSGTSVVFYPNGALKAYLDLSGNLVAAGNVTAYGSMSDEKLKENIEIIKNPIEKIKNLKGVNFTYKKDGKKSTGLIAQDLEKVLPEAVYTAKDLEDEEHLAIRYGNTVGLLVEAIKELEARVEELEGK